METNAPVLPTAQQEMLARREGLLGESPGDSDRLAPARGLVLGLLLSCVFWGVLGLIVFLVMSLIP